MRAVTRFCAMVAMGAGQIPGCLVIYDYDDHQAPPECPGEPNPTACRSCRDTKCDMAVQACDGAPLDLCRNWKSCVDGCSVDQAAWCFTDCGGDDPLSTALKRCMCEQCASESVCFECE